MSTTNATAASTGTPTGDAAPPRHWHLPRLGVLPWCALGWLGILTLAVVAAKLWPGVDPAANDYTALMAPPSPAHLLGTDNLGRDVFVRTLEGAGYSLAIAVIAVGCGGSIGVLLGTAAGYMRGVADAALGVLIDVMLAVPALLVAITVVALRGPSLVSISIIIALVTVPPFARVARSAALTVSNQSYVTAARTLGASHGAIVLREVLPNVLPQVEPLALTTAAGSIILEGALSFLGYGLRPPASSWGGLIADGRSQLANAPWVTLGPAVLLCLTILAINILSEYLSERRQAS